MSQTYQPLKTLRIITAPAGDLARHRTVNVVTSRAGDNSSSIKTCLQAAGVANTTFETVIYSGGTNKAGIPTIHVAGFTAPA
jgi:hypothetical protein